MPYKSEAQRKKFHVLLKQGKISAKTVAEWDKASKGKKLPKKVKKTKKAKKESKPGDMFNKYQAKKK